MCLPRMNEIGATRKERRGVFWRDQFLFAPQTAGFDTSASIRLTYNAVRYIIVPDDKIGS